MIRTETSLRYVFRLLPVWLVFGMLLTGCALHAQEASAFAKLSHSSTPLVQRGSENLLPSPGFAEELEGWGVRGDAKLVQADGATCLRLGAGVGEQAAQLRVQLRQVSPSVLYVLEFEFRMPPGTEFDWSGLRIGLHGWLSPMAKRGTARGPVRIRETRRSEEWLPARYSIFTPKDADSIMLTLNFSALSGEMLTRKWRLFEEPVAESAGRVVLHTPSGDWAEAAHGKQPEAPAEAVMWVPADSDRILRYANPSAEDLQRPLELAGTAGEMCVGAVGLTTPMKLAGLTVSCTGLSGEQGTLKASPSWKAIAWQPRRTDFYGRGNTFHYVADFFVETAGGLDAPAGQTTGIWVNLRIPEDAAGGTYEGRLKVSGGAELSVPVRVVVYPFELAELPERTRHLYVDPGRWERMSDEQVLGELAEVRDHGYESVTLGCRGNARIENGHVTGYELTEDTIRAVKLYLQCGMAGPRMFYTGNVPGHLAHRLGLAQGLTRREAADQWPAELAVAMTEALRCIQQELAALGVSEPAMIAVDEPGYWKKGSPERLLWDVARAREVGWPVFCTSSYPPSDALGQDIYYHCYGGRTLFIERQHAAEILQQTHAAGQKLWYYCTGCYSGQVGNVARNRYLGGFFFFRSGADGTASWTFQRPRGNAFDDFLAPERENRPTVGRACITYPNPQRPGENLDTPHYEGLRQGYYDHRYAETLRLAIERARGRDAAGADAAQKKLDEVMARVPWSGQPHKWPQMNNAELSQIRAEIAAQIIALNRQ